jgi:pimeloyl-ACP methyl ester carboxylesterase
METRKGFDVPRPVKAILAFYPPCNFESPFWASQIEQLADKLPKFDADFLNRIYQGGSIPIEGGISLEGQQNLGPDFSDPRQAFALTAIANGTLMEACFPSKDWQAVDPFLNISPQFPPTCIVHGQEDIMVPLDLAKKLLSELKSQKICSELIEIPGEGHTFANGMVTGGRTWNLQRGGFDFLERHAE